MLGSNPWPAWCDILRCKSRKYLKLQHKQNISEVGSNRGTLKILGVKYTQWNTENTGCEIHPAPYTEGLCLTESSILASVKSTNVNQRTAQIIVPGSVKCLRTVSWPREHQRNRIYRELLNSSRKIIRSKHFASDALQLKGRPSALGRRAALKDCTCRLCHICNLCAMELSVSFE